MVMRTLKLGSRRLIDGRLAEVVSINRSWADWRFVDDGTKFRKWHSPRKRKSGSDQDDVTGDDVIARSHEELCLLNGIEPFEPA